MPKHFVIELLHLADPFMLSSGLENIARLGLISLHDVELLGHSYDEFNTNSYVQERYIMFKEFGKEIDIKVNKGAITINNFGENFAKVCL